MIVIGITGGIGMGKSTVAAQFAQLGAAVCKADDLVHGLLAAGGAAVPPVAALFPETSKNGAIDRDLLGKRVFNDAAALKSLENILHPLVVQAENAFIADARQSGARVAALDIPLLFETGAEKRCDITIAVTAPAWVQRRRVLKRPGMTAEKLAGILARQLPDAEKRKRADFVVHTGLGRAYSLMQVKQIMKKIAPR